jgi:glutathione S-transferase
MPLTVYAHPVSQPSRAVMWALAMNKTEHDFKFIDILKGEASTDEYLGMFPAGGVPALDDGTVRLQEGGAILTYLAETQGWEGLYPAKDAAKRAKINQWLHWHHEGSRQATNLYIRPLLFGPVFGGKPADCVIEPFSNAKSPFRDVCLTLKFGALKDTKFLCGDDVTLADLSVYCEFDQLEAFGLLDIAGVAQDFPEVVAWMDRMKALPGHDEVRAALNELGAKVKPLVAALPPCNAAPKAE